MLSALESRSSGPSREHCVTFLRKKPYSQSASLHPGVSMGTSKYNVRTPCDSGIPSRGEAEIFLVASCYTNRDKLRPDGPLGSYADYLPYVHLY